MISEENKEFFDVLPLNERLLFLCLSKYTKCDVNDDIKEYQQQIKNEKLRTLELRQNCRMCDEPNPTVEYAEHYWICEGCKKNIMIAWKQSWFKPWIVREWICSMECKV